MKAFDIHSLILYNQTLMSGITVPEHRLKNLIASALFAALTAIGAQIRIPLPFGVPITMQTFCVLLSGYLLGSSYGPFSQVLYIFIGLIGFPVFTEGGGPAYVLKPTFGYLLGYPLASYIVAKLVYGKTRGNDITGNRYHLGAITKYRLALAGIAGLLALFIPGLLYLYFVMNHILNTPMAFESVFIGGFLIFIPGDIIKLTVILVFLSFWAIKEQQKGIQCEPKQE